MKKTFREKLSLLMKICCIQLVIALTLSGIVFANPGYSQVLDRKISIAIESEAFPDALKLLELAADVKFAYSMDQLAEQDKVTLIAEQRSLRQILNELLHPRSISYKVHDRESTITLKKVPEGMEGRSYYPPIPEQGSRPREVSGVVIDVVTQQPMAGVNVIVKGTTKGTTTDADGRFTINASASDVLVVSFIGYTTVEVPVNDESVIRVFLEEDVLNLSEVTINAGYYTTTRQTQTGNISKVSAREIQGQPVSNPIAALQGRVPGLEIIQQSGVPGGNFQVRIRGQNSLVNGNDPLYIIDGVPYTSTTLSMPATSASIYPTALGASPLNNLNPADIESIEILKDADATAIYGSRGSNGVILITTKRAQEGKTSIGFTLSRGVGKVTRKMDLLNTADYLRMRKEAYRNDGLTPDNVSAPDLTLWDSTRYTDWQEELLGGTAQYTDAQLSIAGGERNTQFSFGTGYHKETTVFPGDNSDRRFSTHFTLTNASFDNKLRTTLALNYAINTTDLLKQDLTGRALLLAPNAPALFENGEMNWGADAWNGTDTYAHPLSYTLARFESQTHNLVANTTIGYMILPELEIKSAFGLTNIRMDATTATPKRSLDPALSSIVRNSTAFSTNAFTNWIAEPQLNWKKSFNMSDVDVLVGTSFLEQITDGHSQTGNGFSSEALMNDINAADEIQKSGSHYSQYRYHAVFARINYSFRSKYILNVTGRRDGSSRFGPGKRFANFGAVGAAWVFSEEAFVSNYMPVLSFGKLRTSYGVTGNDQIGDYQYLDTYAPTGSGVYNGSIGLRPQRLFNEDFAWETVKKFEASAELGFLKDRIQTTVSYYRNRSSNQLIGRPLPLSTGFPSIQSNFAATVENSGTEVQLTFHNVQQTNFSWTTSVNFTVPKNKLIEFPDLESSEFKNRYAVGEPLNISKLYQYTGVNATTELNEFKDVNQDSLYNTDDRTTIKFKGRRFYGGLQNSLRYKGIQFDFLIEFVKQSGNNDLFYNNATPGRLPFNAPEGVINRWTKEGDQAEVQKYSTLGAAQLGYSILQLSDAAIEDASFVRVKNISLSWTVPSVWAEKMRMQSLRVFVQGQNVITLSKYKGLDPENQLIALPPLRVITGGLNVNF